MLKSVAIDMNPPCSGEMIEYVVIEIEHEDGRCEHLFFDEEELINAAALAEKGCLHD
jgi:hypothetical protein